MAVRKARAPRKPRAPRTPGEYRTTTGAVGGGELRAAAEEIADGARLNAAPWSAQIPAAIEVEVDEGRGIATISCAAPPAYPAETRARHPLFGNRGYWYGPPGERFLGPAADERAGAAMAKYARKVDRLCREAGFE